MGRPLRHLRWIAILVFFCNTCLYAQKTNPFDVYRNAKDSSKNDSVVLISKTIKPAAKAVPKPPANTINSKSNRNNPFDVNRSHGKNHPTGTLENNFIKTAEITGIKTENPILDTIQADPEDVVKDINNSSNPFNIENMGSKVVPDSGIQSATESKPPPKPPIAGNSEQQVETAFKKIISNYFFWILFGWLILITFIVNVNRSFIPELCQSLISENYFRVSYREYSKGIAPFLYYLLYANYFVQGAIFASLLKRIWLPDVAIPWILFLLGILAIYMIKHFVLYSLGALFPVHKESSQYSFTIMQFNIFLGLVLFCLNWVLLFGPGDIISTVSLIGIGTFILVYFVRQFRGLLIGVRLLGNSKFHFFLYLCTVEIIPVILAYKYFSTQFL